MSSVAPAAINREWIQSEFVKGIGAEEELSAEAKTRSDSPPDPSLSVLYNEISLADSKHRDIVEAIATRYRHTPTHSGGGIGEACHAAQGQGRPDRLPLPSSFSATT